MRDKHRDINHFKKNIERLERYLERIIKKTNDKLKQDISVDLGRFHSNRWYDYFKLVSMRYSQGDSLDQVEYQLEVANNNFLLHFEFANPNDRDKFYLIKLSDIDSYLDLLSYLSLCILFDIK